MEPFSVNELGGLITLVAGAVAIVLFALHKSSCTDLDGTTLNARGPMFGS
eukprot:COSAG02_NODE_10505_length_1926_cov_3.770662_2_plen_50_part_00